MKILLDTHMLIWLARAPDRLKPHERALLDRQRTRVLVSAVSIWELRLKWMRGGALHRDELLEPQTALEFAERQGFDLVPLIPVDCAVSLDVPIAHRDPFDEQLLIHTQSLGARLLTRDRLLVDHPLAFRAD